MIFCLFINLVFSFQQDELLVGGASCKRNLFWSQSVPGIHTCQTRKLKPLKRCFGERKQSVLVTDIVNESNSHCFCSFSPKEKLQIKYLAEEDSYLTFYYRNSTIQVKMFNITKNNMQIYTQYHMVVDNSSNLISISAKRPKSIDLNENISFSFTIERNSTHFIKLQKHPNYFTTKVLIILLFVLILFVFFGIQILRHQNQTISYQTISKIWRQPDFAAIELAVTTYGIGVICSCIVYLSLLPTKQEHFLKIINSGMIGFIFPSIIRVVLSKYIGEYRNTVHLSIAPMIYNIFFILPLSGANWFGCIFYKSLRGYGGHVSLFISFILSSLMVFVCKISGRIGKRIKISQRTDTSILIERPREELCKFSFREIISIICYVIIGYVVGQDILRCAYEYYLLNLPLDVHFIIDRVIIFILTSSAIAGFRTFIIYKYDIPASWMSGNVTQNFLVALTVGMREVVRLFVDLIYNYHFEASVYYATCVMSTIGLIIGIGAGFSLIISFIITFAVFNRNDVELLDTE